MLHGRCDADAGCSSCSMRCYSSRPKVHQQHSARAEWFRAAPLKKLRVWCRSRTCSWARRRALRWQPQRHAHSCAMLPCYRVITCYTTAVVLERAHAEGCSQLQRLEVTGKVNVLQTVLARHALALRASARARACCHQHYALAPDAASRRRAAPCRTRRSTGWLCCLHLCTLPAPRRGRSARAARLT